MNLWRYSCFHSFLSEGKMSLYRLLAKKVHPDLNGNSSITNELMKELNAAKNDNMKLMALAQKWGFDISSNSWNEKKFQEACGENSSKEERRAIRIIIGTVVEYVYRKGWQDYYVKGVITKVRDITRGKWKGGKEFTIYDITSKTILKVKTFDPTRIFTPLAISRDKVEEGLLVEKQIKEAEKRRKNFRNDMFKSIFESLGLEPSRDYSFHNLEVLVLDRWGFRWLRLIKTTPQKVVVENNGKRKYISVKKVDSVRKRRINCYV